MAQEKVRPSEVTSALDNLGLTEEIIEEAVLEGELQRDFCTPHHPTIIPGIVSWGNVIRSLRDNLVVYGWKSKEDTNYPTVVNSDDTVAIAVASGDEGTGQPGLFPNVKRPKGPVTNKVVLVNQESLLDFLPDVQNTPEKACVTWLLLRRRSGNRIFFELSLPAKMENGFILEWDTRIIFKPRDIDGDLVVPPDAEESDQNIDVRVTRKAQG